MQQTTSSNPKAGQLLGIFGLILGILSALISFIPCLGIYAIFPGIAAIILSIISIVQASGANAPKGLAIAGLACSILGTAIAGYQYYVLSKAAKVVKKDMDDLNKLNDDLGKFEQSTRGNYNNPGAADYYNTPSSPEAIDYNETYDDVQQQYNDAMDDAQQQYNDAMDDAQQQINDMDLNP